MEKIARKITELIFKNKEKYESKIPIYSYAIAVTITTIITGVSLFVINSLLFSVYEAIAFILTFSVIRMFAGGYHCPTFLSCYIVSNLIGVATIFLSRTLFDLYSVNDKIASTIIYVVIILSLSIIVYYSPSPDTKRKLSKKQMRRNKRISAIMVTTISLIIVVLLSIFNNEHSTRVLICSVITLLSISVLLIIKIIIERSRNND